MNYLENVRANEFDQLVGKLQTDLAIQLGRGKSILDIGCGVGQFTPMFLDRFERVVGLDASDEFLGVARSRGDRVEYVCGFGESFRLNETFDTISMNMLLEHVDDPIALLQNSRRHLAPGGVILVQVPNANSVTRRLGVLMGVIDGIGHISDKERNFFGHQRTYTMDGLVADCEQAGLKVLEKGGLLFKPLPNDTLGEICAARGKDWADRFIAALLEFGKDRPEDCANLWVQCQ